MARWADAANRNHAGADVVTVREALRSLRDRFSPPRPIPGDAPDVRILPGVKLYREVRIGGTRYRGARDSLARPIDYVFDALPAAAYRGARVLDIGTAGGAVCFGAIERGASHAVGLELAAERIRGARALKRLARVKAVEFQAEDSFTYLGSRVAEFDVVFVLNVLHHVPNIYPLLHRIGRASSRYVVVEGPAHWTLGEYASYNAGLTEIDDAEPIRTFDGIVQFMTVAGFDRLSSVESSDEAKFHRDEASGRMLMAFERRERVPERLAALELYRESRSRNFDLARADPVNVDVPPGASLPDVLAAHLGERWHSASMNFLLVGPRGSGKSYFAKQFAHGRPHPYNGKIFKSPDGGGRDGLTRHLNPQPGTANLAAEVLVGPLDDDAAHCQLDELAHALRQKPVMCLLLNVPFDEHVRRLTARETSGQGVDYDISLRYNCASAARVLKEAGIAYRIVSVQPTSPAE